MRNDKTELYLMAFNSKLTAIAGTQLIMLQTLLEMFGDRIGEEKLRGINADIKNTAKYLDEIQTIVNKI